MKSLKIFLTALKALRRNLMRASLTTLGVVIGIAAVIAMMDIGQGSSELIRKSITSMGANNILILPGTAASGGVSFGSGSEKTLTPGDCDAINRECPSVLMAAPIVRPPRVQVIYGNRNWIPMSIYGTSPDYLDIRDWNRLSAGQPFTERDVRTANRVCLIGETIHQELFQGGEAVGREIRIANVSFKVIGVLAPKGANMMGMNQDDIIIAPWTTIKYRLAGTSVQDTSAGGASATSAISVSVNTLSAFYPSTGTSFYPERSATEQADNPLPIRFTTVDQIIAEARSADQVDSAVGEITRLVANRHRIREGEPNDFTIRNLNELTGALTTATQTMTRLLLIVALISLIVGGVGIMNIMLVSVTERTREIGLRMAVGARGSDILRQFLIEAVVLCLAGGVLGILFGRGVSFMVRNFAHWPTQASTGAVIASFAVSVTVGLVFGFYPAYKASRLDPIEALRYE